MEHFYDIEEFKGGGRISPENSATDFPKGTLGVGKNGKVWINLPDKKGRLSWKPTENDFPISYIFSFGYWDEETFDFQIKLDGKELFKLRYAYEYENSYLVFTYPNGDTQETAGSLYELLDFFNDNFVAKTFDLLNTNPNINGELIQSEVRILFGRLRFLINNKGLRSPEKPATPKFKVGDKIKLPTTCWGRTPEGSALGLINLAKAKNQPFLYVDEIVNEANGVWLTLNEGVGVKDIFKIEEDNLELYEDPKFKVGDEVVKIGGGLILLIKAVNWSDAKKEYYYDLIWEQDNDPYTEWEVNLQLANKTPDSKSKFKVGDKVQLPKSKLGKKLPTEGYSFVYEEAINKGQDYLYVIEVFDTEGIVLATEFSGVFDIFDINDDDIKLYSEEQPYKVFKIGDKVNLPLTSYFSDVLNTAIANNQEFLYVTGFGKGNQIILDTTLSNTGDTFDMDLDDITLYVECSSDPNKIISGQVKAFYDRNKSRIDNLESNFSCKIIQALVSLSEYEKCGSPSSATLGKAKTDLLSKISKLKA